MRYPRLVGLLLVAVLAFPATRALAQDPGSGTPTPVLPDLAPREVEIRGELEIAFPTLQRQPLIGFNPPPRVIEIPAGRMPYVAPYKQEKDDLPPSPLIQPQPPAVSPLAGQTPVNGEFATGLGRYFSRFGQARGGIALGDPTAPALYGRLEYQGTDGHPLADAPEAARSRADLIEGTVGLTSAGGATRGGVEVDGFTQDYTLYGARLTNATPYGLAIPLDSIPDRRGRGGGLTAWFEAGGPTSATIEGRVRLGAASYETDRFADTPLRDDFAASLTDVLARAEQAERRVDADVLGEIPIAAGTLLLGGKAGAAGHDVRGEVDGSAAYADALGALRFVHARRFTVTAGARLLAFSASGAPEDDESWGFVSPVVRIETYPSARLRLYAENRPGVEPNALADLYRRNPYLFDEPYLRPTLRTIDAEAGLSFFTGPVQVAGRAGFRRSPNHLFFEERDAVAPGYDRGFFAARYGEADIMHAGGDVSVVLPAGFHATAGLSVRDGRLTEQDAEIPYFAPVVGQAMLSYSFDGSRGLAQLVGSFESVRPRAVRQDSVGLDPLGDADAYLDLDVRASYNISPAIGLLVRVENIGRTERWMGYPRPPAVLTAGLRIHW